MRGYAYYNDIDPGKCEWVRELIKCGIVCPGEVDERRIEDVSPEDLKGFTQCHFFAGIAIWSYALRLAGWPDDRPVVSGSCPCTPFSSAGKMKGFADERDLWPAWFRLIEATKPPVIFGEQVINKEGLIWYDRTKADLNSLDYAVMGADLPASAFGAPHIRQRLFFCGELQNANATVWQRNGSGKGIAVKDALAAQRAHGALFFNSIQAHMENKNDSEPQLDHRDPGTRDSDERLYFVADTKVNRTSGTTQAGQSHVERIGATLISSESAGGGRGQGRSGVALHGKESRGKIERPSDAVSGANTNGRDAGAERLQRGGQYGLRAEDGCSNRTERIDQWTKAGDMCDTEIRRLGIDGSTSGSSGHATLSDEAGNGVHANGTGSQSGWTASATAGHRSPAKPAGSTGNGTNPDRLQPEQSERERTRSTEDAIRDWRGPGWLDPIAARSASEAGATRGFWSDCDWWGGRDGKYRPIGPGISPLVGPAKRSIQQMADRSAPDLGLLCDSSSAEPETAEARVLRLRGYGDGIVAQAAAEFIKAYMECE